MIKDEQWPLARLIPISSASGVEAQERRAASALLAVLSAVDEFGRALLKPLGAPAGKIETFIEIPLRVNDKSVRPDGIITVTRGGKSWGCIVEVKIHDAPLEPQQVETYLDLAKELGFEAVLTISNQYTTSSSEYPIALDKRKLRKTKLYHWSWAEVVTEATVQKQHRGVKDRDQAYILWELVRYLTDPRSGALTFDDMGPAWVKVRDGARERTLRKTDPEVEEVAHRWDALVRYLCLHLTKDLGRDVAQVLSADERASVSARQNVLKESLATRGELSAEMRIPDVVGALRLVANLATRQVLVSTTVDAPKTGTAKGRVSWLLRQLASAPDGVKVEARVARSSQTLASTLGALREDPSALYPDSSREIRQFVITMSKEMGLKRLVGRGSFISSVNATTEEFYSTVLEKLTAWKAKPPRLSPHVQGQPPTEIVVDLPPAVDEGIEEAVEEMEELAGEAESNNDTDRSVEGGNGDGRRREESASSGIEVTDDGD